MVTVFEGDTRVVEQTVEEVKFTLITSPFNGM
jgi:hypothetical protein